MDTAQKRLSAFADALDKDDVKEADMPPDYVESPTAMIADIREVLAIIEALS